MDIFKVLKNSFLSGQLTVFADILIMYIFNVVVVGQYEIINKGDTGNATSPALSLSLVHRSPHHFLKIAHYGY